MPAVGGPYESFDFDGRSFAVAADADIQKTIGGDENEVQPNGDDTARLVKSKKPGGWEGVAVVIDNSEGDLEFLQALSDRNEFFPVAATEADGSVYQATAQIVGEVKMSGQNATAPINVMASGKLTRQ